MTDPIIEHLYLLSLGDDTVSYDLACVSRNIALSPEQRLCAAILEDGLLAAALRQRGNYGNRMFLPKTMRKAERVAADAREWLLTRDERPFGFDFCVMALDLDPDVIRGMLAKKKESRAA